MAVLPQISRAGRYGILEVHDEPVHPLGSIYRDDDTGYVWQYLKAGEALSFGDVCKPWHNMFSITNLANAAAAGTHELNVGDSVELRGSSSNLRHVQRNSKQNEYPMLEVVGGTGAGQQGIIHDIDDHKLFVEWHNKNGTLTTALDTTSDIEIYANWFARQTDAADETTICVVQQWDGVKLNEYFWGLYCGVGIVTYVTPGSSVANPARGMRVTSAASGRVYSRLDANDSTVAVLNASATLGASATRQMAAQIMCELLIGEVPTRTDLGYTESTVAPAAE